jgi:hypothetical protein
VSEYGLDALDPDKRAIHHIDDALLASQADLFAKQYILKHWWKNTPIKGRAEKVTKK